MWAVALSGAFLKIGTHELSTPDTLALVRLWILRIRDPVSYQVRLQMGTTASWLLDEPSGGRRADVDVKIRSNVENCLKFLAQNFSVYKRSILSLAWWLKACEVC